MSARSLLIGGAVFSMLALACAFFWPAPTAGGWLVGYAFWSQVIIGSLCALMIHRLTSGRWGEHAAPVWMPAASAVPLLFVPIVPALIAISLRLGRAQATGAVRPDVGSYYLNMPFLIGRSFVAIAAWAILAILILR